MTYIVDGLECLGFAVRIAASHVTNPLDSTRGEATVNSLVLPSGDWNVLLVFSSFLYKDTEAILSLPLGLSRNVDSLLWHFENSGSYSVRSGYRVARILSAKASSSRLSSLESWWKFL
ncbi:hypothetical protein Dsin_015456 [Dipteronia sinensis]|uniref:Uncharacterized protein n=1 Tax=Dipteronia sinensis TaxID=43782 RepID=A0AAE0ABB2_9ROSI|nr:hypothetical protein Dsin_015456 [Dipteronia sinensis]